MWRDLLLSGKHQALCHFFNVDFFIWFFMTERDVGLASGSMASAAASSEYPAIDSFAARSACPGTYWIKVTILFVSKCTDVGYALVYSLLMRSVVSTGGQAGNNCLAVCEDLEQCDVMCTAIFLAELSCEQHSPEFSMIGVCHCSLYVIYHYLVFCCCLSFPIVCHAPLHIILHCLSFT